jgi:hypothetical protein
MVDAARLVVEAHVQEIMVGRGNLEFLLDASLDLLTSEFQFHKDRSPALERHWELMSRIEEFCKQLLEQSRIPLQDFEESRYARLQAEHWRMLGRETRSGTTAVPPQSHDPPRLKALAKAKRNASRVTDQELLKEMTAAAQLICKAKEHEFINGRGTMNFLLDSTARAKDARIAAADTPSARFVPLDEFWLRAWFIGMTTQNRFDNGRLGIGELSRSQYHCRDAARQLVLARRENQDTRIPGAVPSIAEDPSKVDQKHLAKAKWSLANASPAELANDKLDAASVLVDSRMREFVNGRGTLRFILEYQRFLLQAVQDADPSPRTRRAAVERYWEFLRLMERIEWERFGAGRLALQDYLAAKYDLLAAEILLADTLRRRDR